MTTRTIQFLSDKPVGHRLFCKPETKHFQELKKSVLNTITFNLEDDKYKEVIFNGETLTFTIQLVKI